jgi:chromosome segregation ATPase
MTPTEIRGERRAATETDLKAALERVSDAQAELRAAEDARAQVKDSYEIRRTALTAGLNRNERLAGPLQADLADARTALSKAEGAAARARGVLANAQHEVAALRETVSQLDRGDTADKVTQFPRAAVESTRRKTAPIVEYSDVEPARTVPR